MGKFFRDYILNILVTVAVTATVTALALINHYWTWPNAIVGAILLFSGTLYLADRFNIGPSTKTNVRNWLDNSGYAIQTIHDTNDFHFVMTDNVGLKTDIIRQNRNSPIMIATVNLKPSPQQTGVFQVMTPAQKNAFWKNVRLELLRYGIAFSDLTLDGTHVSDLVMPVRSLTESEFLARVMFVRSGARLYLELLDNLG